MFLRFLAATKKVAESLVSSVPKIAGWKLCSVPRFLPAADIDQMLAACDDRTDTALRDIAIILLASRLGLRAGDIAALTFGDVDWQEGCLRVSGKSRAGLASDSTGRRRGDRCSGPCIMLPPFHE